LVLRIELVLSEMLIDLITTDDEGEQLLVDIFLVRVPGGDRRGLFDSLRKSLGISADTRDLAGDLGKVYQRRNDLAHRQPIVDWHGHSVRFGGENTQEVTSAELASWSDHAANTWLRLVVLHAELVTQRRPDRSRAWMEPVLEGRRGFPPMLSSPGAS
jgi:hypothetical protein